MENLKSNQKVYWYIIVLISFFIIVFVTKSQIYKMQINLDTKSEKEATKQEKRLENEELESIKEKYKSDEAELSKYSTSFSQEDFMNYIYSYIETLNQESSDNLYTIIKSLSFWKSKLNELWFNEVQVNLIMEVPNEQELKSILKFLTDQNSKYKIFIDSLSYEFDNPDKSETISLPLKIFYK